ncbi:MAG: hypothetical protein ACREHG_07145, partial [Candidatus Saccharimonadales bacterium]
PLLTTRAIREPGHVEAMIRDAHPAAGGPDGDTLPGQIAQYPGIIGYGAQGAEPYLGQFVFGRLSAVFNALVGFIGIGDLSDAADGYLGRKARRSPGAVITTVMKLNLIKASGLPRYGTYVVAKGICLLHGLKQLVSLLGFRAQLYFQGQFHRLLSFQLIILVPGGTAYSVTGAQGPSFAAMIAHASAMYLRFEKYSGRFFGLLSHQTPVRNRT